LYHNSDGDYTFVHIALAEWLIGGTLKLVWWRERARQRQDAETEDEWEARLRQWRERDI